MAAVAEMPTLARAGSVPDAFRAMTVADAMTRNVFTVTEAWTLLDAARSMRGHHVSGFPVVDDRNRVVGILSESNIVEDLHAATGVANARGVLDLFLAAAGLHHRDLVANCLHHLRHRRVGEAMSRRPVTIAADDSLAEAARVMRAYGVNRLPVLEGDRLVGIVTRQDIVEALSQTRGETEGRRRYSRGTRADAASRAL